MIPGIAFLTVTPLAGLHEAHHLVYSAEIELTQGKWSTGFTAQLFVVRRKK